MTLIEIENSLGQVYEQMDGSEEHLAEDEAGIRKTLLKLKEVCYVLRDMTRIGLCSASELEQGSGRTSMEVLAYLLPLLPQQLGDRNFMKDHGVRLPYMCGAMANGIASERLVIAMGEAGLLGSFGAAGLVPSRIEEAIQTIQTSLPERPYAFNLIHSPAEDAIERAAAELFLKHQVKTVEASAFLDLTPHIVHYRVNGLSQGPGEQVMIGNRVIAKISRSEVAEKFMRPPPERILAKLVQENRITETQARLASRVPMADDITVEADSGGHTDNRPLVSLLPSILSLRDRIQEEQNYSQPIRVGAGGGISTPASALAAFMMGAGYVVTGSVNQGCVEAAASEHTKKL
ncbi:MAG: nitronate monooxygenase, partial [SAR324 cluster bacterium]|nr:nitronate monooxygenase [SAR324 cluster bacterium]